MSNETTPDALSLQNHARLMALDAKYWALRSVLVGLCKTIDAENSLGSSIDDFLDSATNKQLNDRLADLADEDPAAAAYVKSILRSDGVFSDDEEADEL